VAAGVIVEEGQRQRVAVEPEGEEGDGRGGENGDKSEREKGRKGERGNRGTPSPFLSFSLSPK
jgi:hypothetical protein